MGFKGGGGGGGATNRCTYMYSESWSMFVSSARPTSISMQMGFVEALLRGGGRGSEICD